MRPSRRYRRPTAKRSPPVVPPVEPFEVNGATSVTAAERASRYIAEVRRILGRFGARRPLAKGDSLFRPGDTARHLYIIESGQIDVTLPEDAGHYPIASFHPGASFLFDFGGHHVAACEAAVDTVVIDLPYRRLRRLSQQGMELRLLLGQCHAFDLKSFLDVCYPPGGRFKVVHTSGTGEASAVQIADPEGGKGAGQPCSRYMLPLGERSGSESVGAKRRRPNGRRARPGGTGGPRDGDE